MALKLGIKPARKQYNYHIYYCKFTTCSGNDAYEWCMYKTTSVACNNRFCLHFIRLYLFFRAATWSCLVYCIFWACENSFIGTLNFDWQNIQQWLHCVFPLFCNYWNSKLRIKSSWIYDFYQIPTMTASQLQILLTKC